MLRLVTACGCSGRCDASRNIQESRRGESVARTKLGAQALGVKPSTIRGGRWQGRALVAARRSALVARNWAVDGPHSKEPSATCGVASSEPGGFVRGGQSLARGFVGTVANRTFGGKRPKTRSGRALSLSDHPSHPLQSARDLFADGLVWRQALQQARQEGWAVCAVCAHAVSATRGSGALQPWAWASWGAPMQKSTGDFGVSLGIRSATAYRYISVLAPAPRPSGGVPCVVRTCVAVASACAFSAVECTM
jgi:hypothetical protein